MGISNYPSDFQPLGPEQAVLLSDTDPTLFWALAGVVAVLAVVGLMTAAAWWAGGWRLSRPGPQKDTVAEDLHKALVDALKAAMTASTNALPARAQEAAETFERLLGPVLLIGAGTREPLEALKKALVGKADEKPKTDDKKDKAPDKKPEPAPPTPTPTPPHPGVILATSPALVVHNTVVTGAFGPVPPAANAPAAPKAEAKPEAKPEPPAPTTLPIDERARRLRDAIQVLFDHWSAPGRVEELKAARRALSIAPPKPRTAPAWQARAKNDTTGLGGFPGVR